MSARISRRDMVGGAWVRPSDPIRLPWALPEAEFTERCTACGDCVDACPRSIVRHGRAGYPEVDLSHGACDFCGECAQACGEAAFRPRDDVPWRLVAVFSDDCLSSRGVTCRICAEWCDTRAIRFAPMLGGRADPRNDVAACTGCGACISVCPAKVIHLEEAE